jgi:crotonobetainyl-CoA:carnitine CoA-transferase CaiB-like acyl-CoA transferase
VFSRTALSAESDLPLSGLRIVEIGTMVAGPYACAVLGDLGADVIKLESPGGDTLRRSVTFAGTEHWFSECNRGKRSFGLDLTAPRGQDVLSRLIAKTDAVVCNLRPDTLPKLGLSFEQLSKVNPQIVMVEVSAFGSTGPWGQRRGTAPTIDGSSGISSLNGDEDGGPLKPPNLFGDIAAALFAALGVVAAIRGAKLSGRGEFLDVAMSECVSHLLGEAVLQELILDAPLPRLGNVDAHQAPHGCYPCSDADSWISIAIESDSAWRRFIDVVGDEPWVRDPRYAGLSLRRTHRIDLDADVSRWTAQHDPDSLMVMLQGAGIASGVVSSPLAVSADPQLGFRDYFGTIAAPYGLPEPIARFPGRPNLNQRPRAQAPQLFEHADEILDDLLQFSADEMSSLYEEKVCFRAT